MIVFTEVPTVLETEHQGVEMPFIVGLSSTSASSASPC